MHDHQISSGFSHIIQFFSNLPLLRVISGGKRPFEKRGVYDARRGVTASELERDHLNAGVRLGDGLVVLDIDPRNGGSENLAWLLEAFGALPYTWKVDTAGGGHHYYFSAPQGLRKRLIAPGVELLAEGCYALIPGSQVNGNFYRFAEGFCPNEVAIAQIPPWLVERALEEERPAMAEGAASQSFECEVSVTSSQVAEELFRIHPDCSRDIWIRVGMVLAGLHDSLWESESFDTEKLWHAWSRGAMHVRPSEKYSWKEADKQWTSFRRRTEHIKSFVSYGTLVYLATECLLESDYDWTHSQVEDTSKNNTEQNGFAPCVIKPSPYEDDMRIINDTASSQDNSFGTKLVSFPLPKSEAFMTIYNEVVRLMGFHSHELAFAVTRQIFVTSCARRGITHSGRRMMFNALLVGPPRSGKSTAINVFRRIMDTCLPGYTLGWPDSYLGLQKALIECPNRCMIGDELGASTFAGLNGRSNEFARKNYGVLRGVLAGADVLDAQVSKRDPVPKVDKIYVCGILNSTEDEMRTALSDPNGSNRRDGLTRRFTLFHSEAPEAKRQTDIAKTWAVSEACRDILLRLSKAEVPLDGTPSSPPPFNDVRIKLDVDADVLIDTYFDKCNADLKTVADQDLIPLMLESVDKIEDWACMLAFLDGRDTATVEDVKLAHQWAQIEFYKIDNFLNQSEDYHIDAVLKVMVQFYREGKEVDDRSLKMASRPVRRHLKELESQRQIGTLMALFEGITHAENLYYKKHPNSARTKFIYRKSLSSPKLIKS